jgi:hypothetical protein
MIGRGFSYNVAWKPVDIGVGGIFKNIAVIKITDPPGE